MSLGQLTANYTDSEGEGESKSDVSISSEDVHNSEEKDIKERPPLQSSQPSSSSNTPKKKVNRLVSYANEDDDEHHLIDDLDESDELHNPEPMDTGTEDEDKDTMDLGIKFPPPPPTKCNAALQEKISNILARGRNVDYDADIQSKKEFRNPSIYEKLIDHLQLDEMGSNYPLDRFDPHCWSKSSYYTELAKVQKEEMDKREKERKEKTKVKVDIISGTKKVAEGEEKKRKSRFDQAGPTNLPAANHGGMLKTTVPPPTLTTVPSGNKATIDAFGSLKKIK